MATIYIVEDDVNIREIERYALKNSGKGKNCIVRRVERD